MQNINCAIALEGNSTSSIKDFSNIFIGGFEHTETNPVDTHYVAFDYALTPEYKTLAPYSDSTTMFTNLNSAHCGPFTTCYPLPVGCTGVASDYTGYAKIETGTLAIQANTTEHYGYNETLCIKCENAAGSTVQHDNFKIQ